MNVTAENAYHTLAILQGLAQPRHRRAILVVKGFRSDGHFERWMVREGGNRSGAVRFRHREQVPDAFIAIVALVAVGSDRIQHEDAYWMTFHRILKKA